MKAYIQFSHFKSMETLSCHSNESTRAMAIKTFFLYRLMLRTFLQSFSFNYFMASGEMIFDFIFANLSFGLPWQLIKFSGLDKIHMFGRGLLKEHFCQTFVRISAVRSHQ